MTRLALLAAIALAGCGQLPSSEAMSECMKDYNYHSPECEAIRWRENWRYNASGVLKTEAFKQHSH